MIANLCRRYEPLLSLVFFTQCLNKWSIVLRVPVTEIGIVFQFHHDDDTLSSLRINHLSAGPKSSGRIIWQDASTEYRSPQQFMLLVNNLNFHQSYVKNLASFFRYPYRSFCL